MNDRSRLIDVIRQTEKRWGSAAALGEAVRWSLEAEVTRILDSGVDVDSKTNSNGATCLMYASNSYLARFLVAKGANINATDNEGCTPLVWFLRGKQPRRKAMGYIKTLVELGADPTIRSKSGDCPIELARQKYGVETATLLEEHSN